MNSSMVFPIWAGELLTRIPAAFMALILSGAEPFPPEMMAPACPILRPGGAVRPAMNPVIGLLSGLLVLIHSQAYRLLG